MKLARASLVGEAFQERFRIDAEIGAGGFGTVYRGMQLATGQQVAIKVLRTVGPRDVKGMEKRIARLEREMRLCAQLHHPNIVGLIDFGRTSDGSAYSVFELVPGKNLEQLLSDEGALEPQEARHLMLQVLDALACAHAQGVIHRDLKPSNIMAVSTGARRNALVLDFGIGAVSDSGPGAPQSRITGTNEVVGTIAYAAPEQLLGKPTSAASDLYSWGLVFLECLTGKPVIQSASLMDAMLKQVGADVTLPAALEQHELGKILRDVLAKKPEERPASAADLMKRLEACDVTGLRREDLAGPAGAEPQEQRAEPAPPRRDDTLPSALDAPQEPESAPPPSADPLAGELRQITVVCATFSADGERDPSLDVEDADNLVHAAQEACSIIAARFHGHAAGALGDQVMFRFGFPAAGEDDARRAARAALEMIAWADREPAPQPAERRARLALRLSIHTGLMVSYPRVSPAAQRLTAAVGATYRVAARLSAAAQPGEIVVSASAQRLLRHHFSCEPLPARDVRQSLPRDARPPGDSGVFRLDSAAPSVRPAVPAVIRSAPLVGREREIDLLLQRWDQVRRGSGQVVLVTGEPGIGKSRLVQELASRLHGSPHRWLECRSVPENRNSALDPVVELLHRMLAPGGEESRSERLDRLRALLAGLEFDVDDALPHFARLLGLPLAVSVRKGTRPEPSPQQAKEQLLNALVSLVFGLSEREPVVLVAEDLQWTDPTTLELFSMIVQEVSSARVLVLFSARPAFVPPWSLSSVLQVQLARLEPRQIEEMVARLSAGREPPPAGVLRQIIDRTDGVPLFVEELTRVVLESGLAAGQDGGRSHVHVAHGAEVPATLRDLFTARLDRLGRARTTAQIAAVLGREFSYDLLSAVSPLGDSPMLREDLDVLVAAEIVQRKRRPKGHSYAFRHGLIRDTALESMLRRARQRVHADIAWALERRFPEAAAARPDLLAQHHAEAGHKQAAIGHMLAAAESSLQRVALLEAVGFAQQALGWVDAIEAGPERSELELRIHRVLIQAIFTLKGPGAPDIEPSIARAQALLDDVPDSPLAIPTLAPLALRFQMHARFAESNALAGRCLTLATQSGDTGAQVSALTILAQNQLFTARHTEARATAERALALYDPRAHSGYAIASAGLDFRALCHGVLAFALWFLGHPDQALAEAERGLQRMEELEHPPSTAMALLYLAGVHRYRRDLRAVADAAGRLHVLSQRHGIFLGAFAGVLFASLSGDAETPAHILGGLRAYGQVFSMPYWYSTIAESHAAAGRIDAALERIEECIREAEAHGEAYYLPELLRLKGTFFVQRGPAEADPAEACFRRAIDLARSHESRMCELRATTALASLLRGSPREDEARSSLAAILSTFHKGITVPDLEEARALLGEPLAGAPGSRSSPP